MPDYVLLPAIVRTGSGPKQVGDSIILADAVGLMLQVKSRCGATGDEARETNWVGKQVVKAIHQANGSLRMLERRTSEHQNIRGRTLALRSDSASQWITVVIIDHDRLPIGLDPAKWTEDSDAPVAVLTRQDWEFLWEQLKSGVALARYLDRVTAGDLGGKLGEEAARYYKLAYADSQVQPGPEPEVTGFYGIPASVHDPALPIEPAGHARREHHLVTRLLLEEIALAELQGNSPPEMDLEWVRLKMLWALDALPVRARESLGAAVMGWLEEARRTGPGTLLWRARRIVGGVGAPVLGVAVTSLHPGAADMFHAWARLAHAEACASSPGESAVLLALLVQPEEGDEVWAARSVYIEGATTMSDSEAARLRARFEPGARQPRV